MTTNQARKRLPFLAMALALVLLSGPGCMPWALDKPLSWNQTPYDSQQMDSTTPRPVTADQITAENAHAQVQAVLEEMARERNSGQ